MTAVQHKTLAFIWILANILLVPHIRPQEGTASLYTDVALGLSGLPLCWWVWRDRREKMDATERELREERAAVENLLK